MKRLCAALGVVLALSVLMPGVAHSQTVGGRGRVVGSLGQNYPNPFNPETHIPFAVGDTTASCANDKEQHRVSMKIYTVIMTHVATPILQSASSGVAGGQPLEKLSLPCGTYVAYWDGKIQATGREAASGIYVSRLEVDGVPLVRKMVSVK